MQGNGLEKEPWAHLPLLALFRAYSHCFETREEQMSLRLPCKIFRAAGWLSVIRSTELIFRSTVISSPLSHFQPCASNGRLRRDEGLSTSLNSLLSTKRRRWRSESSPLAPLDRGCVEWQPASQTRPHLGFGPPILDEAKPVALFCFFSSPEGQLPRRGILIIGAGPRASHKGHSADSV